MQSVLSSFAVSALIQALTYGTVSRKGRDCINDTKTIKTFAFSRASKLYVSPQLLPLAWLPQIKTVLYFHNLQMLGKRNAYPTKVSAMWCKFSPFTECWPQICNSFQFTFFPKILCQHLELGKLFNFFAQIAFGSHCSIKLSKLLNWLVQLVSILKYWINQQTVMYLNLSDSTANQMSQFWICKRDCKNNRRMNKSKTCILW